MKKMGRPPKNPEDVKITSCYCLSKDNIDKIVYLAKMKNISASKVIDSILNEVELENKC